MSLIFKREWRSLFRGPWCYGFLGVFALVFGIIGTLFHYVYGYTNFEFGLPYYAVGLSLALPLLTVPYFRGEHRGEGWQLLRMLPISAGEWIRGKLLCLVGVWGAVCGALAFFPLIVNLVGDVEYPSAYLSLLIFFLYGLAWIMIEAFLSISIRRTWLLWIVSYGLPVLLILLNGVSTLIPWEYPRTLLSYLSLIGGLNPVVFSWIDLRVPLLYASVAAVFCLLILRRGTRIFGGGSRRREKGAGGLLVTSGILLCAILLNLGASLVPGRFRTLDASEANFYTLAEKTKEFLGSVDEDVTIYLIDADGDDQRFEYFMERIAQVNSHFCLKKVDLEDSGEILGKVGATTEQLASIGYGVVVESEKRVEIIDYGSMFFYETDNSALQQLFMQFVGYTQIPVSTYYELANMLYSYANQNESYLTYLDAMLYDTYMMFMGQRILCSMVEYVTADVIPHAYAVTGHGEVNFASSFLSSMLTQYGRNYGVLDITGLQEIPADASCLLIMAPTEDYTAGEIQMLLSYLERGGQVTMVTNEANLAMPNLMSLMAAYGMSASAGTVGIDVEVKTEGAEGEEPTVTTERSDSVKVTANLGHDAFAVGVGETSLAPVITKGNAISFEAGGDSSLTHGALLTTSDKAYVGEDPATAGKHVLAAAAETAKGAHLLWFTGANSFTDTKTTDIIYNDFCLYMVESWATLNYRSQVEGPEATRYEVEYSVPTGAQATVFGILWIGVIPLTLFLCGAVITYKRKKA